MFKKFLARKKDFRQLAQSEVNKALIKRDQEHSRVEEEMRRKHQRVQADFQVEMNNEISKSKKAIRKHFETLIEEMKKTHTEEIKTYKTEIKDLESKIKFVQEFWRNTVTEKDYILNLTTKMCSKVKAVFDAQAYEFKDVETQVGRIEASSRRLDAMEEKHGNKLIGLLEEK